MSIKNKLLMLVLGSIVCPAFASDFDIAERRFAQTAQNSDKSKEPPASRDELFGVTPSAPAPAPEPAPAPSPKPGAAPSSRDELFGVTPSAPTKPAEAPSTREELFGISPAPEPSAKPGDAPSSRDELFTTQPPAPAKEPEGAIKWSGFFDEVVAYTYAEPGHWSRAVSRLQLTGQGQVGSGLKFKLSGRVDADPVYMTSDFYPGDVKEDQRLDFFLRETYLDFSAGDFDFRVGRQQIVWGEVVGLFFADVVSARDMREFILPSFEILRIPQWTVRAEYFKNDFHAELIWLPVQDFDEIGEPGAEFYPAGLIAELTPTARFNNADRPDHELSNSAYGLRLNTLLNGWDFAAFYYRSYSTSPAFYREIDGSDVIFTPRHSRIWQTGATVSKDVGQFLLRAEAIYTHGQHYSVTTLTDTDGVTRKNTLEYIIGLDFSLPHDTRFNLQAFNRHFHGGDDDIAPETGGYGMSILLSTKLGNAVEPQILWIQSLSSGSDRLIRPSVSWSFAKNASLAFGADIFAGPSTGFFGRFRNRDRLYTELRYDF